MTHPGRDEGAGVTRTKRSTTKKRIKLKSEGVDSAVLELYRCSNNPHLNTVEATKRVLREYFRNAEDSKP